MCPVVYVNDLEGILRKVIQNEASECDFKISPDTNAKLVIIGICADSGGGSMKWLFTLMNHSDRSLSCHTLLMYEASDTIRNDHKVLGEGLHEAYKQQ